MKAGNNLWERIDTALFVVHFTSLDELKSYREAIRLSGLNVNNCELLALVGSKKEREVLSNNSVAIFLSEKDLNFLGSLKNPGAQKILGRKYDALIFIGDYPTRLRKLFSKIRKDLAIGLNCPDDKLSVNLETVDKSPQHLINFAQQTLQKIR